MPPKSRRGSSRKIQGVTPIRYRTDTDTESDETPQPSTSAKSSLEEIILERLDNPESEVNSLKRKQNDDPQSKVNTSKRKHNNKIVESAPRNTTKSPPNTLSRIITISIPSEQPYLHVRFWFWHGRWFWQLTNCIIRVYHRFHRDVKIKIKHTCWKIHRDVWPPH